MKIKKLYLLSLVILVATINLWGVDYRITDKYTNKCTHTRVDIYTDTNGEYSIFIMPPNP